MPRLSLGLGVDGSGQIAPAAPSGIPVASTASVVIAGQNATVPDGTYTKVTANATRVAGSLASDKMLLDTGIVYLKEAGAVVIDGVTFAYGQILVPPNTTFTSTYGDAVSPQPYWRAGVVRANYSEDEPYFYFAFLTISTNSSTDATTIPTTGWDGTITITAAPSGLPYSSTNSIDLVDASYPAQSGNYPKIVGSSYPRNFTDALGTIIINQYGQLFNGTDLYDGYLYFVFNVTSNRWEFGNYEAYGEGYYAWATIGVNLASNPSTNQNYIPTSGWSRNLVITAGA